MKAHHSYLRHAFLCSSLLLIPLFFLQQVSAEPYTSFVVHNGVGRELQVPGVQTRTGTFLNVDSAAMALTIVIRSDFETGLRVFCTTHDCRPVYTADHQEVLITENGIYVSAEVIAEALGCRAKIKKRDVVLTCAENWTAQKVGVKVGERAPGFRLKATADSMMALNGLLARGPVVVAFVRSGQWDPLSRVLLQELETKLDSFRGLGCEVVAIHGYEPKFGTRWATELKLRFNQLSDNASAVMRGYEVFDKGNLPFCAVFLLDREGIIRFKQIYENPETEPDVKAMIEELLTKLK